MKETWSKKKKKTSLNASNAQNVDSQNENENQAKMAPETTRKIQMKQS